MKSHNPAYVFGAGAAVGVLGGLIGLGGAEFRLPLLIGLFGFAALPAVILNKAMSLFVVASALPLRASSVPWVDVLARWEVVATLLGGSLLGAWQGAGWAVRVRPGMLHRLLAVLWVLIALVLVFGHGVRGSGVPVLTGVAVVVAGMIVGFGIGVVASLMGVAGGELLIPTIVLLFGADIKLAGSLSLVVSLPTMLVGFARYSADRSFAVIGAQAHFVLVMAGGSVLGSFIGSRLLGIVPAHVLLPVLAALLCVSAFKLWRHAPGAEYR